MKGVTKSLNIITSKNKPMSKAQSKHEFFHKGFSNQKRPDIVIDLRRPSADRIGKWTPEQKKHLPAFIKTCEAVFAAFINELKEQTNDTTGTNKG